MKFNRWRLLGACVMTAALSTAVPSLADDGTADGAAKGEPQKIEKRITVVARADGNYWIGVHAVPVDAALKSHLGLADDRLIVRQVIDDSPAKEAGVQVHDVLLSYGDATLATLEDLVTAVEKGEGKEMPLALIRGGKEMKLALAADKRPANQQALQIRVEDVGEVQGLIGQWIQNQSAEAAGNSPLKFRFIGPGFVDGDVDITTLHEALSNSKVHGALSGQKAKLPQTLSIQIKRENDAPAVIKVTRDKETWEVTEEGLGELPADVRSHVRGALEGRQGVAIGFGAGGQNLRLKALQVHPEVEVHSEVEVSPGAKRVPVQPSAQPGKDAPVRAFQIRRQAKEADGEVEKLRKDVEELKAAVRQLQAAKPSRNKKKDD